MRIIIIGVSGFDSQQRKCKGSAFEEAPTFQALPLSSCPHPVYSLMFMGEILYRGQISPFPFFRSKQTLPFI